MATVAASVAVICVVALTNSQALAESAGAPVGAAPVVVPAGGASADGAAADPAPVPTPTPTSPAQPSPSAAPQEPTTPDPVAPQTSPAEIVPAPDAQVVTPAEPAPALPQPSSPAGPSTKEEAVERAMKSGSWELVRAWAEREGWSADRIDAFVARLERALNERLQNDAGTDADRLQTRNDADSDADAVSVQPKDRPAPAGASADQSSKTPGIGEKKDRSRHSPWRDR
ncbi:hypothetical protein ACFQ0P_12170 [Microbacterium insulae]|uniref:Uncharacterized protein n=1 Tax=Microbacterium insulae TaxID=483014 RepID=A0ABW3AJT0_9MICO